MNIKKICDEAQETAKDKGFSTFETNEIDRKLARIALMHCELAEAAEEVRKDLPHFYYEGLKPEGLAVELADCVIRICQFCGENGIDLDWAIKMKMDFNKSRPYKHGKVHV